MPSQRRARREQSLLAGHRCLRCGDEPDAAMPKLDEVIERGGYALPVVGRDREVVARARRAVEEDERDLLATKLAERRVGRRARGDEDPVDAPLAQDTQIAGFALVGVVGVA